MQLLMVCLLVGVTMSALVYASALQQCRQLSKYSSHYGIALPGYSYKSFIANLLVTCYRACQQEPSCQSLNYNLANRICEFNTFAKRPDDLEDKLDNFVCAVNPNREGRLRRTPAKGPNDRSLACEQLSIWESREKSRDCEGREKKEREQASTYPTVANLINV